MKKKVIIILAVVVVLAAAVSIFTYSYRNPKVRVLVGKNDQRPNYYVENVLFSCKSKFGTAMPQDKTDEYKNFCTQINQLTADTAVDLKTNYTTPVNIKAELTLKNGKTVFAYTGTATSKKAHKSVDYHKEVVFDYIISRDMKLA